MIRFQRLQNTFSKVFFRPQVIDANNSKFVDLAPTNKADPHGIYFEAMNYAITNPNVLNIALTGPYGSGKSSVIKAFLQRYRQPALHISLASFESENDPKNQSNQKPSVSKQEIERSILQQMLYGADANKLPLSRFRRIQSPKSSAAAVSFLIVVGLLSTWHLLQNLDQIREGKFFTPLDWTNWLNLGAAAASLLFAWQIVHYIYLQSFGLSLKAVSLRDIEIAPKLSNEESILNRYLDEIIYFFQATHYELVIVEDLDRFEDPEIFVTLREINALVNSNAGVKRQVKFLYAIRDDVFESTDRTKFFEFIIPIVPIVNHSNSIDMVLEEGHRLSLGDRLDRQFLREVSRYLIDLRLIRNIFNEYAVYIKNLEKDNEGALNPNKLLAVLIYKNVLPGDFEQLHQQKGLLASLLTQHDAIISNAEEKGRNEIDKLTAAVEDAKKRHPRDNAELRKIYAMALIEQLPAGHSAILFNSEQINFGSIATHAQFEGILSSRTLSSLGYGTGWQQSSPLSIEQAVDPEISFKERRVLLEKQSDEDIKRLQDRISQIRSNIARLRSRKFSEVLRTSPQLTEEQFEKITDNKELMRFLILEGHLDDTYYQYISLFHKGRLSPHDNRFLIQIRSFVTPEPDFPIDNPSEVIAAMRTEDFGQTYVLNRHIFDHLLATPRTYASHLAAARQFVSENFSDCEEFFESYYRRSAKAPDLIRLLIEQWPEYPTLAVNSRQSALHVSRLIAFAPDEVLLTKPFSDGPIVSLLSADLRSILSERLDFDFNRILLLRVEVQSIASLSDFPEAARFLVSKGLYQINLSNVRYVFEQSSINLDPNLFDTRNFTSVLESGNSSLISRVEADFARYVSEVLLKLTNNTEEAGFAILAALNYAEVPKENLEQYWRIQVTVLPTLAEVPESFQAFAIRECRVKATWQNCLTFLTSGNYQSDHLTAFLLDERNRGILASEGVPDGKEALPLRQFLLNNEEFDTGTYRAYVSRLPREFKDFPTSVNDEKLRVLIEERRVSFSIQNSDFLGDRINLKVLFAAKNIDAFLSGSPKLSVDDDFRMKLLSEDVSLNHKRAVVDQIDPNFVCAVGARASQIGPILDHTSFDPSLLGFDFLRAVIINSRPAHVQVSLLNKSHKVLNDDQVRSIILDLPDPYCDLAVFGKSPRLENIPINVSLADWLVQRRIVSSWRVSLTGEDVRVHTFRRQEAKL